MTRLASVGRPLFPWLIAVSLIASCGELAARVDDWIFQDVPLSANADRDHDLLLHDRLCIRGRPHGQFKKYKLNGFGFRGPEIPRDKPPATTRIMILGASEAFGLYESEGHEFATLLQQAFVTRGDRVEIVNAAIAGMNLLSLKAYWENWASGFNPDVVVIYPSPQFYLDNEPPRKITPRPDIANRAVGFRSRLVDRLISTFKQSELIKSMRAQLLLWEQLRGRDSSWLFSRVPEDRLDQFRRDLDSLATAVATHNARPILLTHAFRAPAVPDAQDLRLLEAFRTMFPRAEPRTLQQFDAAAAQVTREIAATHGWAVIDASAMLSGQRELFADPVHFDDAGSEAMATLLARELPSLLDRPSGRR